MFGGVQKKNDEAKAGLGSRKGQMFMMFKETIFVVGMDRKHFWHIHIFI